MESKTKLLDQMRHVLRLKHLSLRTEEAYVQWAKRFILFHHKRHPADMGAPEIRAFLTHLAVQGQVAASTQNVALQALLFLYRHVLKQPFPELGEIEHARKSRRVPVVFARQEVAQVLAQLTGTPHLMASLLYGAGLRLMECVRLRVTDVDFAYHQLTVRDGKGAQDRVTILPQSLEETLQRQLARTKLVHEEDLATGYGEVYLPYAFARKDPHAGTSWEGLRPAPTQSRQWQYVFPAAKRSIDPRSGQERRHHISETVLQKAVHKDVNQQPFSHLQNAFTRFFRGEAGYPKFKKKGRHDSFYISNDKLKVDGQRLSIPRLGWVKMREELRFTGTVLGATVSREADRWFVSLQVDVGDQYHRARTGAGMVGVDLGVTTLATLSTGEKIESPKPLQRLLKRLQTAQRRVSRRRQGSHNRRKAVQRLARLHQRIKHTRHDVLHKLTSRLGATVSAQGRRPFTSENQVVAIENLHVKGMMANHHLAQAVGDMGFHEFRRQLTYKAALTETHLVVVDRWFPSSKTCSQCGTYHASLTLAQRILHCDCGFEIDRDHNAAINLARVGYTRSHACGDTSGGGTMIPSVYESRVAEAGTTPCTLVHTV